ncbi:MAG TPA: hypothetical protein VHK89_08670, partial [Actinomycetota bacterium]|nr:hypothetical protein [Actinomycetota bacterium]
MAASTATQRPPASRRTTAGSSTSTRLSAALALSGVACAAVVAGAAPAARGDDASARAAIGDLLRRRARAVVERDEAAFRATNAGADEAFERRQRESFRWGSEIALDAYSLRAKWGDYGDLTRPSDRRRYAGFEDIAIALVEERYRVAGFDQADAVENLFLTFVRDDGEWLVASDSDLADVGVLSARHLWDFGPVEATTSEHFTLLTHPCAAAIGCAAVPEGLLGLAEDALAQVDELWRLPWNHHVLMLAPTEPAQLGRMLQATFDLDSFVAFATATADLERDGAFSGFRVLLKWQSLAGRTSESLRTILAHELAHVATRPASGPFVPTFVEEGIAEVVGHEDDPAALLHLESLVASDSDLADVGVLSARHLWDFGPVEATTSEHFTLLTHPCAAAIGCAAVPEGLLG